MKRAGEIRRTPMRSRPRATGPSDAVVDLVLGRDQRSCVCCGEGLDGARGCGWSIGHRRPRRMGGDRRPDTNGPANLVSLCGSGTTGCHGWLEANPLLAREQGLVLRSGDDPTRVPATTWYGVVLLGNDGGLALVGAET